MKILVTGAAGFIGSTLCERLLQEESYEVIGLDALIPSSTPVRAREHNLSQLLRHPRFTFIRQDLLKISWESLLPNVDIVYHLAGIPGVRSSWGDDFKTYIMNNIEATQRLLEGCRQYPVKKFIYASTSSVYGEKTGQVNEAAITEPLSPYGVSKLTGEHLCKVYAHNDNIPVVILRFFTVYGPRQRPDMAFHRFITHILHNKPITIYGDGHQTRDFTYVEDCVTAIAAAAAAEGIIGETINIGGKERASVLECISMIEDIFGKKVELRYMGKAFGEPRHTWADISKAQTLLGYEPTTDLCKGMKAEILDICNNPSL
ncbi:putative UDP-glucose epimerase YtcB [Paenibacillus baekrokdamisoli]|uniref:Putative UDP-glucose epimerase YtcB n=1 Tax=Paenibacillus baekrokdamisoli TaxID=1712516 RepID=A0A3G9J5S1_9BACL|nr:NAD-dependent epimerase/dehydratase family protein [Paenibacillus baekrokdamisoli]MBB3070078.1 nucleoside-diphosphate-sugar epimerase [Paenibacillus baekrokdamisoli]BBH21091.1 putative UDP-glucose epimerase YtcB [Paenibacillus baekrokdamisoli]